MTSKETLVSTPHANLSATVPQCHRYHNPKLCRFLSIHPPQLTNYAINSVYHINLSKTIENSQYEYSCATEPPVRYGVSHRSGGMEPPMLIEYMTCFNVVIFALSRIGWRFASHSSKYYPLLTTVR